MRDSKLWKVFSSIIAATFIVVCIYLMIDSSSSVSILKSYDAVKPDSTSGFSKQLQFVESYTRVTQDTTLAQRLGVSEEDAEAMAQGNTTQGGTGNQGNTGNNYKDAAIAIASTFKSHNCTYKGTGHVNNNYEYSRGSSYGECNPSTSYTAWSYKGKQHATAHRDCSCFVSSMLYALGYESAFIHRTSSNYGCFTDVKSTIGTCADLRPGDILRRSGHVAMVVSVESGVVYVADCGSTSHITQTANNGYAYTYNAWSALPSTWTQVYRP